MRAMPCSPKPPIADQLFRLDFSRESALKDTDTRAADSDSFRESVCMCVSVEENEKWIH